MQCLVSYLPPFPIFVTASFGRKIRQVRITFTTYLPCPGRYLRALPFKGSTFLVAHSLRLQLPIQAPVPETSTLHLPERTIANMRIIQREGNSCPPGAKYYICPRFEGCCEVDACKVGTCPRQYIPTGGPGTTVAAVAPPVMVSEAPERSSTISSPRGITTYFSVASTDGGAWYTDTKTAPAPASSEAITSLASPSSSVVEVPSSSSSAPKAENENKELSAAAKGGIFGAIAALVLALVVGYFICRKKSRARKLRSHDSTSSFDRDEGKDGVDEDDAHPPMTAIPSRNGVHSSDDKETLRPEDVGASLRGKLATDP